MFDYGIAGVSYVKDWCRWQVVFWCGCEIDYEPGSVEIGRCECASHRQRHFAGLSRILSDE